jgi:hypothetical protein
MHRSDSTPIGDHWLDSRVPKLGPPLYVRPLHRSPCRTPALANSSARYNGSWNLSFTLEALIPAESALPRVVCVWFGFCRLRQVDGEETDGQQRLSSTAHRDLLHLPSQIQEPPDHVGHNLIPPLQRLTRFGGCLGPLRRFFRAGCTEAQLEVDGGGLQQKRSCQSRNARLA